MKKSIILVFFGVLCIVTISLFGANKKGEINFERKEEYIEVNEKLSTFLTKEQNKVTQERNGMKLETKVTSENFEAQSMCLNILDKTINIGTFDWYKIGENDIFTYIVDAYEIDEKVLGDEYRIVNISIYPQSSKKYSNQLIETIGVDLNIGSTLEITYINRFENNMIKEIMFLKNDVLETIDDIAVNHKYDKDSYLSKKLLESNSIERLFKSKMFDDLRSETYGSGNVMSLNAQISSSNYSNTANTVRKNEFDEYTNSDGYLLEHMSTYKDKTVSFNSLGVTVQTIDDLIVNIIPKNLFKQRGVYSYVGKEYGFYIKTIEDIGSDNTSEFIVFDIDTVVPFSGVSQIDNSPSITIRPLFTGNANYDSNFNIVFDTIYVDNYLALGNINITGAINNVDENNVGDSDYDKYEDYGYAFSSFYYDVSGVGIRRYANKPSLSGVKMLFGAAKAIPNFGGIISASGIAITNFIEFITEKNDGNIKDFKTNEFKVIGSNTESMIKNYGNLVKAYTATLKPSEDYPLLYKTKSDHFTVKYTVIQKNAQINWDAIISNQITLDIYRDNTSLLLGFIKRGSLTKLDTTTGGRSDIYNEIPKTQTGRVYENETYRVNLTSDVNGTGQTSNNLYSPSSGSYHDYVFIPERTYSYVIETMNKSSNSDPYLKIYNFFGSSLIKSDDDSASLYGNESRNSRIEITLNQGSIYKIRAMSYNYKSGSYDLKIRKNEIINESVSTMLNNKYVEINKDYIWYTFTPKFSDFYTIYTTGNDNTQLEIYDAKYQKYAFDDNSGFRYNASIDMYLLKDKKYYVRVNLKNKNLSSKFNLFINRQRNIRFINENSQLVEFSYGVKNDDVIFYRFKPTRTHNYTIYTGLNSGNNQLKLYNKDMEFVALVNNNAELSYNMKYDEVYYISIHTNDNSGSNGKIYIRR